MALAITLLDSKFQGWDNGPSGAATETVTSASVTPGTDCVLVVLLSVVGPATNTFTSVTPVSSGSGPSWTGTSVEFTNPGAGYDGGSAIWAVQIGGSSLGSFTVATTFNSVTGGGDHNIYIMSLYRATGHNTTTPTGGKETTTHNAGNGAVTITLDAAPATADVTLAQSLADQNANNGSATFGTGTWTTTADGSASGHQLAYNTGYRTASTSASVPWADVNTGADNFASTQAAVVIADAAGGGGGGGSLAPSGLIIPPVGAVQRASSW